jgi:prepilin-type N-terminal cleavage/methylation domain-containing protein
VEDILMRIKTLRDQSGFALVELMVAMSIFLLILVGILQVFDPSSRAYPTTEQKFEGLLQLDPANATVRANLESVTRKKGIDRQRQDQIGAALKAAEASPKDPRPAYDAALAYARLGDSDNAFAWLKRALNLGYDRPGYLSEDPDLASLRKDPRFTKLLDERRAQR